MIVLDESLDDKRVMVPLRARCKGKVVSLRELRPGTIIKDDAVAALLRQYRNATFITINVTDFWRRIAADRRYSIICAQLPTESQGELPELFVRLLHHQEFRTIRKRVGKVIRLGTSEIAFYGMGNPTPVQLPWP